MPCLGRYPSYVSIAACSVLVFIDKSWWNVMGLDWTEHGEYNRFIRRRSCRFIGWGSNPRVRCTVMTHPLDRFQILLTVKLMPRALLRFLRGFFLGLWTLVKDDMDESLFPWLLPLPVVLPLLLLPLLLSLSLLLLLLLLLYFYCYCRIVANFCFSIIV